MSNAEQVTVLGLADRDRWEAEHEDGGLPSQAWGYARALSATGIEPQLAVVRAGGARMLLPFFKREYMGQVDIATTMGLSGTSIAPASTAPLSLWREYAAAEGWVAGYLQLDAKLELATTGAPHDISIGNTVFVLDLATRDPIAAASATVRQKIRRAHRLGSALVTDPDVVGESLVRLYGATRTRTGAGPLYDFPAPTLEGWAKDPNTLAIAATIGGRVEAASLFLVRGARAEYHLNASTEPGRELTALLIADAIARLQAMGVTELNLGGGGRPGDGVHTFKARFHGDAKVLGIARQIYNRPLYDEFCALAGASDGDWFPAYRVPPGRRHAATMTKAGREQQMCGEAPRGRSSTTSWIGTSGPSSRSTEAW